MSEHQATTHKAQVLPQSKQELEHRATNGTKTSSTHLPSHSLSLKQQYKWSRLSNSPSANLMTLSFPSSTRSKHTKSTMLNSPSELIEYKQQPITSAGQQYLRSHLITEPLMWPLIQDRLDSSQLYLDQPGPSVIPTIISTAQDQQISRELSPLRSNHNTKCSPRVEQTIQTDLSQLEEMTDLMTQSGEDSIVYSQEQEEV